MKKYCLLILLALSLNAHSLEVSHLPEVGLGYTNNANYESTNTDKDFYGLVSYGALFELEKNSASINIGYMDFKKQSDNDLLSWSGSFIFDTSSDEANKKGITLSTSGQHYVNNAAAKSDESFNSLNFGISYSVTKKVSESYSYTLSPSYSFTKYLAQSTRRDHLLGFSVTYTNKLNEAHSLSPFAEVSYNKSSDGDYSKFGLGIGTSWDWIISDNYELSTSASLGRSTYVNRTISTQTLISRKKRSILLNGPKKESHTATYLGTSLTRIFDHFDLKAEIHRTKNSSNGESENYTEYGGSLTFLFYF